MVKPQSKIIVIDNNPDHLELLAEVFHKNGIGCLPILYDQLTPPSKPCKNVRLAFFDINLRDISISNEKEIFNDLANAINDYIDKDNGPFALIFWTQNAKLIPNLKKYIFERRPETPKPYLIKSIDKHEFYPNNGSLENFISDLLSAPTLDLLFDFEEHAQQAASKTINSIYKSIPNNDDWGDNTVFDKNFELIFSKIAIASLGFHHAKENPDKAIYEALGPATLNLLVNSSNSAKWKGYLKLLADAKKETQPDYPDNFDSSELNTIFHIDFVENISKISRGAVVSIENGDAFSKYFEKDYSSWFSSLLPGLDKKARVESKLFAVEISASCDFAQKKPRTYKYLLGVLIKDELFSSLNNEKRPQYLFELDGSYSIAGEKMKICLNLNYVFSAKESDEKLGSPLFIFKKEIVDMIGNRYANHVSRIGITSF
jgi:hypothetical protein